MRWRIDLSYDGTGFRGWATQPGLRTVQETLEVTLTQVLRLDEQPAVTVAGRTDAGVHARGQVVHVDLPVDPDPAVLLRRLDRALPTDVRVGAVAPAAEGFDARFSALWRRYVYRLADQPGSPDPLARHCVTRLRRPVDVAAMADASGPLLGEHDFAAFCRRREGASTVRSLLRLEPARHGEVIEVTVVADAFCHSMVRALVGGLVAVGEGRLGPDDLAAVLASRERSSAITVLPAHGLTLEEVGYPDPAADPAALADRATATRRFRG